MWVTLPYEPGRHALAGSAATVQELAPLARGRRRWTSAPSTTRRAARPALHHLERGLFEGGAERRPPNGAVRLLEAGGERAEAEIVGAEVLELMRDGIAAEDIAVLVRGPGTASLFAQVLGTYGIPVAWSRQVPLGAHAARRRRAGGRCAPRCRADARRTCSRGCARRGCSTAGTPAVDALEARVRRTGGDRRPRGRREWARVGAAAARRASRTPPRPGPRRCSTRSTPRPRRSARAPYARRADVLDRDERDEARVAAELRSARGRAARAGDPRRCSGDAAELLDALGGRRGAARATTADGVLLADPLDIRARRFRAVVRVRAAGRRVPARPTPEPFLDDDGAARSERRATGLRLPFHEDVLDRERSLFYVCVSRAAARCCSCPARSSDEEGEPLGRVAVPRRRARPVRRAVDQRGRRRSPTSRGRRARRRPRRECERARRRPRNEPDRPPDGLRRPRPCSTSSPSARLSTRALEDVRATAPSSGSSSGSAAARASSTPDPE